MNEKFTVSDHAVMGLSETPEDQHFLPPMMRCPVGHRADRHFHYNDFGTPPIPFYVCYACTVVYRYQECGPYV